MRILLLNQAFWPDVVSSGQHATDLARCLADRGHEVTVITARRAYDRPEVLFPGQEGVDGVRVLRVRSTGFGKKALWRRAADFGSFMASCAWKVLRLGRFDLVVAMTTPPLLPLLGALLARLQTTKLVLWLMDLNPHEAVAAGCLEEQSLTTRILKWDTHQAIEAATTVVVLDRFMKQRLCAEGAPGEKMRVIAPWSHDSAVRYDGEGRADFRREHGLEGKFVVMYSGNHSPCHPLDTVLESAHRLAGHDEIRFCFVGGGSGFARVTGFAAARGLRNTLCLPYQPLSKLSASLSAADLHVVVMGDPFVGIVHPCKVYNILRLGIPFLYLGPPQSHIADLVPRTALGRWAHFVQHGEVDKAVAHILRAAATEKRRYEEERRVAERFSASVLVPEMIRAIEGANALEPAATRGTHGRAYV